MTRFKMGSLNHVHLVVPDRAAAARWYQEQLGFELIEGLHAWVKVDGGPLHMSADGGRSGVALFQAGHGHDLTTLEMGAAFDVSASQFVAFSRMLSDSLELRDLAGKRLEPAAIIDLDLCYAYSFADPWGNHLELNCFDVEAVKRDLIDPDGIEPIRYW